MVRYVSPSNSIRTCCATWQNRRFRGICLANLLHIATSLKDFTDKSRLALVHFHMSSVLARPHILIFSRRFVGTSSSKQSFTADFYYFPAVNFCNIFQSAQANLERIFNRVYPHLIKLSHIIGKQARHFGQICLIPERTLCQQPFCSACNKRISLVKAGTLCIKQEGALSGTPSVQSFHHPPNALIVIIPIVIHSFLFSILGRLLNSSSLQNFRYLTFGKISLVFPF